jgi:WD40 repeat protein
MASGHLEGGDRFAFDMDTTGAVAVTADGQRIVSSGTEHTLRVWDLASGTELAYWVADTRVLSCAAHSHDPTTFVYGDADGRVAVLSLREALNN